MNIIKKYKYWPYIYVLVVNSVYPFKYCVRLATVSEQGNDP